MRRIELACCLGGVASASVALALAGCGNGASCADVHDPTCFDAGTGDASDASGDSSAVAADSGAEAEPDATTPDADAAPDRDSGAGDASSGCDGSAILCNGACVDPSQPAHCGSCGHVCPGPEAGTGQATCTLEPDGGAACGLQCSAGQHACNGACLPDSDVPSDAGDPCVLSERFGVFVATGGSDSSGDGTRAAPYATVSHALTKLGSLARVYVCNGSYSDAITIGASVALYGGLSCSGGNWSYAGGSASVTSTSATGGPALTVSNVSGAVHIEDVSFAAQNAAGQDGSGNGNSSIAGWVSGSSDVELVRAGFTAGNGAPGRNAPAPTSNWFAGSQTGSGATGMDGGAPLQCGCPDTTTSSAGGSGGNGVTVCSTCSGTAASGGDGGATPAAAAFGSEDGKGGAGASYTSGTPPTITSCAAGDWGAPGVAGVAGVNAAVLGTMTATSWAPATGSAGGNGNPGQGGGGGGGSVGVSTAGAGGGGGGCGGCGGAGGLPGGGGGSSFAMVIVDSVVGLSACTLTAGNGQNGGNGSTGEAGQGGGGGTIGACSGGNGGPGAGGGGGGGGAGGSSVGIAWTGSTSLTIDGTAITGNVPSASYFTAGTAGSGGPLASGGTAATGGNAGLPAPGLPPTYAVDGGVAAVEQF